MGWRPTNIKIIQNPPIYICCHAPGSSVWDHQNINWSPFKNPFVNINPPNNANGKSINKLAKHRSSSFKYVDATQKYILNNQHVVLWFLNTDIIALFVRLSLCYISKDLSSSRILFFSHNLNQNIFSKHFKIWIRQWTEMLKENLVAMEQIGNKFGTNMNQIWDKYESNNGKKLKENLASICRQVVVPHHKHPTAPWKDQIKSNLIFSNFNLNIKQ